MKPLTRNSSVLTLTNSINQTLFILFGEIIEADLEDYMIQESNQTLREIKDDFSLTEPKRINEKRNSKTKDDLYIDRQIEETNEVSHRVVYLLDFINQIISRQKELNSKSNSSMKSSNFDTLNCLMVLYYTVPIRLKSKIVASLFDLMEVSPEICNHDLLPCFILKELVADHTGELKLGQVLLP